MYIRSLGLLLFLTRVLLAQEPTPILPDANMTPGDTLMLQLKIFAATDTPEKCAMYRRK